MDHIIFVIAILLIAITYSLPSIEHFISREFFYEKIKNWTVKCRDDDQDIMDMIIKEPHTYTDVDPDYVLDVTVPNGYMFLGTIVSDPIVMIVTNTHRLFDFADLAKVRCLRIGLAKGTELVWNSLEQLLDPQVLTRLTVDSLSDTAITNRYGNDIDAVIISMKQSLMPFVRTITDKVPSHLVYFNQVNAGNYFVLDSERSFYHNNPELRKKLLDLVDFKKKYPSITTIRKDIYLPTFEVQYVLSCHPRIPNAKVRKTMAQILRLFVNRYFTRTLAEISHNKTSAPDHPIAINIYGRVQGIHSESLKTGAVLISRN